MPQPENPSGPVVDLNADLGEGVVDGHPVDDQALLRLVTSANVACGFHAGDPSTMRAVCETAAELGVRLGAHVSYRDLAGFGRRDVDVETVVLRDEVTYQLAALDGIARAAGTQVHYVKAHGALYNRAVHDHAHAQALLDGVRAVDPGLPLLGLPGSVLLGLAADAGSPVVHEAFPDRAYDPRGRLVPRHTPDSVLHDPAVVAERAVRMAVRGEVVSSTGEVVALRVRSLGVHGVSPGAVATARRTREELLRAGAVLAAFA
jgi:UPF0271 protein